MPEIEITISKKDGNIEMDMFGYRGKKCSVDADEIIKELGSSIKSNKKKEYYQQREDRINQSH